MAISGRPSLADFKPKPRDDAYTVLLTISLLAMIGACLLLYYDLKRFPSLKPPSDLGKIAAPERSFAPQPGPGSPEEPAPMAPMGDGAAPMAPGGAPPMPPGGAPPMPPGGAPPMAPGAAPMPPGAAPMLPGGGNPAGNTATPPMS